MTCAETWLPVAGWEGQYEVSDLGRVRGVDREGSDGRRVRGKIKSQRLSQDGYLRVSLATGKRSIKRTMQVADIVTAAFVGPKPKGT